MQDSIIEQRAEDGYINATAMCKAAGKRFNHYYDNGGNKAFIQELSSDTGIPASELLQVTNPESSANLTRPAAGKRLDTSTPRAGRAISGCETGSSPATR